MKISLKKILIVVAIILVIYLGYVLLRKYRKEKYSSTSASYYDLGSPACDKNYNMVDLWPVVGKEHFGGVYGGDAWVKSHNPYDVTAADYKNGPYTDPIDLESDSRDCALGDNPYACGALKGGNQHYML